MSDVVEVGLLILPRWARLQVLILHDLIYIYIYMLPCIYICTYIDTAIYTYISIRYIYI